MDSTTGHRLAQLRRGGREPQYLAILRGDPEEYSKSSLVTSAWRVAVHTPRAR